VATYKVEFEPGLIAMLRSGGERAQSLMRAGTSDIAHEFVQRAEELAGPGPYGQSFSANPEGDAVMAGSRSPLARVIEKGRKPGDRPPPASIRKRAGGSYAAAARAADKIAARGTRGRYVVKRAGAAIRNDGTIDRIARRVVEAVAHGG
jgi:hypothetical protein